jgi:hypothetical protein
MSGIRSSGSNALSSRRRFQPSPYLCLPRAPPLTQPELGAGLAAAFSILLLCAGAGSLVCAGLAERASWLERLTARVAAGAAALPLCSIALYEAAGLRLRPELMAAIGLAGLPLLVRDLRRAPCGPEPPAHRLLLIVLLLSTFWVCFKGALAFPSFEGRDGWGHALGARYLLDVGVPRQPFPDWPLVHYVDAYPPLFDALLCVAVRVGGSVNAPLKGFAALVASLAVPAFHYLALRVLRSPRRAAVATALWAVLPASLTRHVWAHSLALVLTFAALWAAARLRESPRFLAPGAAALAGVALAAPTAGIKALLLLAVFAVAALGASRRWPARIIAQGTLAVALCAVWYAPAALRYGGGLKDAMQSPAARRSVLGADARAVRGGRGGGEPAPEARRYTPDDFLFFRPYRFFGLATEPKFAEEIAPIGLGLVVAASAAVFLLWPLRRAGPGRWALRGWLAVLLMLVLGPRVGFDFYAWRGWMLLAPLACLAGSDVLCRLARPRGAAGAALLVGLGAAAAVNAGAALWFDHSHDVATRSFWSHGAAPGPESPWFFLRGAPLFAVVAGTAAALGTATIVGRAWRAAVLGGTIAAHVLIAAPIRLRALTRFVEPLGYASELEYHGYLALLDHTRPGDRVLTLSLSERSAFLIGLDRRCEPWSPGEHALERDLDRPGALAGLPLFLREHRYAFVVADPTFAARLRAAGRDPAVALETLRRDEGLEPVIDRSADGETFLLLAVRPRP